MTNGRGAGMASFMTKKKKYKFQVDVCLEELLEVPFVSAVLFAKLRLLDGGNFQDHSTREEVRDHRVQWGSKFSFPCKMLANASTGVLERCILRISVRKECKGGRSFTKLGFVDVNLAEYAGAGLSTKISILEGYDMRRRQDNSLLKCSISMNMLSGDVLFKVPSPSAKHKSVTSEDPSANESIRTDEFSSGSLGSGSSGFGSLPKKRPPLLSSELIIGYTLPESNGSDPIVSATTGTTSQQISNNSGNCLDLEELSCDLGHSRNSSNTSQLSKASGYSSIHSHSRQSSSGDSGHNRDVKLRPKVDLNSFTFNRANSYPYHQRLKIPTTIPQDDLSFSTPIGTPIKSPFLANINDNSQYFTPPTERNRDESTSSAEIFATPNESVTNNDNNLNDDTQNNNINNKFIFDNRKYPIAISSVVKNATNETNNGMKSVMRSQSDFIIPRKSPPPVKTKSKLPQIFADFLTPTFKRKTYNNNKQQISPGNSLFKLPKSPNFLRKNINDNNGVVNSSRQSFPETIPSSQSATTTTARTISLNSLLRAGSASNAAAGCWHDGKQLNVASNLDRTHIISHRKLMMDSTTGGKLAPVAISPDETPSCTCGAAASSNNSNTNNTPSSATCISSDCCCSSSTSQSVVVAIRRPSVTTNPSASSLVLSETGSLDRAKAAYERRKKTQVQDPDSGIVSVRVENTRPNPDHLIAELLKDTNLEQADDSAENSGLQLFIAKDGTASLGNHEVKSQVSTGVFKQVVMDDNR